MLAAIGLVSVGWIVVLLTSALADNPQTVELFSWINSGDFEVDWALRFDTLTAVMLVVVTTVSSMVHVYSIGYMSHDRRSRASWPICRLFTFFMLMLVTADNLVQMFFGWEGVGLASYLLIGFWYEKTVGQRGGDQGLRGQPGRRFRLCAGHLRRVHDDRVHQLRHDLRGRARSRRMTR